MFIKSAILATTALLFTVSAQAADQSDLCERLTTYARTGRIFHNDVNYPISTYVFFEKPLVVMNITGGTDYNFRMKGECVNNTLRLTKTPGGVPNIDLTLSGTVKEGEIELKGKGSNNVEYTVRSYPIFAAK